MRKDRNKMHRAPFFILLGIFLLHPSFAQITKQNDEEKTLQSKLGFVGTQLSQVALENVVNPDLYFVGPSDVINVNIWISPPINFVLTVTPEGTLIVPTVGEIAVADLTLAQAKKKIINETRKKYITAEITATLLQPRPIIVSVSGNVVNEGLYTLSAIDRASRAIEEANKLSPTQLQLKGGWLVESILKSVSMRNVILKRKDGSLYRIDLVKFLATKEDRWNPYLREGDVIIVPKRDQFKNVIGIYGEVNAPGRYEYVEGDSILDALKIGQGFTRLAYQDSIELYRYFPDGRFASITIFDYDGILSGRLENIALQPGDRIVVKGKSEQREDYRVEIEGEIKYPGIYPITKNQTKLSEIIQRAGGFTEFVSLKTAHVIRQSIRPEELSIERLMSLRGGTSPDDSADYILETDLRLRKEIVNVDFERLFEHHDDSQDIILQSEDKIVIPSVKQTVYVFGQVVTPGHVSFREGASIDYYIKMAGGFTERARKGDVKIIKGKTKQWLDPDETTIEEGDYVWIPKEPERTFAYYMNVASQSASVLSMIIGIAVIIIQLTK